MIKLISIEKFTNWNKKLNPASMATKTSSTSSSLNSGKKIRFYTKDLVYLLFEATIFLYYL